MIEKLCKKCGVSKPICEYYQKNGTKDGLFPHCKECEKLRRKEYNKEKSHIVRETNRKQYEKNGEKYREQKKEYYLKNKDKIKHSRSLYYEKNRHKVLEESKKYGIKNKEKIKNKNRDYYVKNKDKFKEYISNNTENRNRLAREYNYRKTKTDENYVIKKRLSGSIHMLLKRNFLKKNERTHDLLGCTIDDAIKYLKEKKYNPEAHDIDHIVPASRFNLSKKDHRLVAFNFKNLQPLTKHENRSKQDSLPDDWDKIIFEICYNINIDAHEIISYINNKMGVSA